MAGKGYLLRDAKQLAPLAAWEKGHRFNRRRWSRLPLGAGDMAQHWVIACSRCEMGLELVPGRVEGRVRWWAAGPALTKQCEA